MTEFNASFERDAAVAQIRQIAEGELKPEHVDPYACDLIAAHWPRVFVNAVAVTPWTRPLMLEVLDAVAAAGTIDRQAELKCRLAITDVAGSA